MYFEGDKVVLVYDIYIPCLPVFCICVYQAYKFSVWHMHTKLTRFLHDICVLIHSYQISAWYMCIDSFLPDFYMICVYQAYQFSALWWMIVDICRNGLDRPLLSDGRVCTAKHYLSPPTYKVQHHSLFLYLLSKLFQWELMITG